MSGIINPGGGGGGTPGGSPTQVQFNNAGAFGGVAGSAVDVNGSMTLGGSTVNTASDPVLNLSQTWNNATIATTGASGTGTVATITFAAQTLAFAIGSTVTVAGVTPAGYNGTFTVTASTTTSVSYSNATTGAQTVAGTVQLTSGFSGIKLNVTNTASAASSLLADLQVGGTSQFNVSRASSVGGGPALQIGTSAGTSIGWVFGSSASGFSAIWTSGVTATGNNFSLQTDSLAGQLFINATASLEMRINNGGSIVQVNSSGATLSGGSVLGWNSFDTGISRVVGGVMALGTGAQGNTAGWFNYGGQSRVTADFSVTSSTVLTNVTGLSVTVLAGRTYKFTAEISWTDAAAGGIQAAISGTATATNIIYDGWIVDSAANGIKGNAQATALGTAVASAVTTGTAGHLTIEGTITVNAAGTLTVQIAQNTSNATATVAKRGSTFIVQDMP